MSFADECTRVYTRRGHSAHLLAPEGTLRTGVLCGMAKRATAWLGTGSDKERAKAASLPPCEECEYQAWTEDEYRSEGPQDRPEPPLGGFAAECTRMYAPAGTVAHLCPPFTSSVLTAPLCGLDLAWPVQWLGTGSQREHERAASLPLCGRCLYEANSDKRKFKPPASLFPRPEGDAGLDGAEDHLAPAPDGGTPAAVRGALPARSPSGRRAAHPVPGPPPGSGCAPQIPAGGSEGMPPAGEAPVPKGRGAGGGTVEPPMLAPEPAVPGAGPAAPGATAGASPAPPGDVPAAEAPSPSPGTVPGFRGRGGEGHASPMARPAGGDGERGPGEPVAGDATGTPPQAPAGGDAIAAAVPLAGQSSAEERAAQREALREALAARARDGRNRRGRPRASRRQPGQQYTGTRRLPRDGGR